MGSIQQRILDPLAGATRDTEGTINLTVKDIDLKVFNLDDEEVLKTQFQDIKAGDGEYDEDVERLQNLARVYSSSYNTGEWNQIISDSLDTFKKGEKYDYVRDLKAAYGNSLSTTNEQKIFKTLPDYVFWDIKKPQGPKIFRRYNRYGQQRGREHNSFFDMRESEEYMIRQHSRDNLNDSTTLYRQY